MKMTPARLYLKTPLIYREVGIVDVPEGIQTLYVPGIPDIGILTAYTDESIPIREDFPIRECVFKYRYDDPVTGEKVFVHETS